MSIKVFLHLDDPADLARASCVLAPFRDSEWPLPAAVLELIPEMSSVDYIIDSNNMTEPVRVAQSDCSEWDQLKKNRRVYALLSWDFNPVLQPDCISEVIRASSTDNDPEESICNALEPNDRVEHGASYWSSKGQSDPTVPEVLVY